MKTVNVGKVLNLTPLKQHKILQVSWVDYPSSDEFREGMNKILDTMEEHGLEKILTETSRLGAISPEDQEWVLADWVPRSQQRITYKAIALVLSTDIFNQLSIDSIMADERATTTQTGTLQQRYFDSLEAGRAWLETVA